VTILLLWTILSVLPVLGCRWSLELSESIHSLPFWSRNAFRFWAPLRGTPWRPSLVLAPLFVIRYGVFGLYKPEQPKAGFTYLGGHPLKHSALSGFTAQVRIL